MPSASTAPAPKRKLPWHQQNALWALERLHVIQLTPKEMDFLANMVTWPWEPSKRQADWLVAIGDKIEAVIEANSSA